MNKKHWVPQTQDELSKGNPLCQTHLALYRWAVLLFWYLKTSSGCRSWMFGTIICKPLRDTEIKWTDLQKVVEPEETQWQSLKFLRKSDSEVLWRKTPSPSISHLPIVVPGPSKEQLWECGCWGLKQFPWDEQQPGWHRFWDPNRRTSSTELWGRGRGPGCRHHHRPQSSRAGTVSHETATSACISSLKWWSLTLAWPCNSQAPGKKKKKGKKGKKKKVTESS